MTSLLELQATDSVLEIGTGSGYQTAVLANLVHHVSSVERIKYCSGRQNDALNTLILHNISTRHGDGWEGWVSKAL